MSNQNRKYTTDDMAQSFNNGVEEGKKHIESSPETIKRFGNLEKLIAINQQQMEDIKEQNTKEHLELKELIKEEIKKLTDALDTKANKWVEKVLIGIGSTMGFGFMGILGWLVVEAIKRWK